MKKLILNRKPENIHELKTGEIWGNTTLKNNNNTIIILLKKQDVKKYNWNSNKNIDGLVTRFASNMVILNQAHS